MVEDRVERSYLYWMSDLCIHSVPWRAWSICALGGIYGQHRKVQMAVSGRTVGLLPTGSWVFLVSRALFIPKAGVSSLLFPKDFLPTSQSLEMWAEQELSYGLFLTSFLG